MQEFVVLLGMQGRIVEYNQENLRIETLEGGPPGKTTSLIRSFPSKVGVRAQAPNPAPKPGRPESLPCAVFKTSLKSKLNFLKQRYRRAAGARSHTTSSLRQQRASTQWHGRQPRSTQHAQQQQAVGQRLPSFRQREQDFCDSDCTLRRR